MRRTCSRQVIGSLPVTACAHFGESGTRGVTDYGFNRAKTDLALLRWSGRPRWARREKTEARVSRRSKVQTERRLIGVKRQFLDGRFTRVLPRD